MTIAAIREAIAAAVDSTGVVLSTPYVTDQANTPQAMVIRGDITYNRTYDPTHTYDFTIAVYVTREARTGQELLDDLADPDSPSCLKTAVENDPDLKEIVQYVTVVSAGRPEVAVIGETQYLSAVFEVQVVV